MKSSLVREPSDGLGQDSATAMDPDACEFGDAQPPRPGARPGRLPVGAAAGLLLLGQSLSAAASQPDKARLDPTNKRLPARHDVICISARIE